MLMDLYFYWFPWKSNGNPFDYGLQKWNTIVHPQEIQCESSYGLL